MPTKQPPEPSLRTILKAIRRLGGAIEAQGDRLESQVARLDGAIEAQGDRFGAELGSQVTRLDGAMARLEGSIRAQGERLDDRIRSQGILLEEMRSQNHATIEAVEATRLALEQRIDRLEQETGARDRALELAIKDLRIDVKQNSLDLRDLTARVAALQRIEDRVSALERRGT